MNTLAIPGLEADCAERDHGDEHAASVCGQIDTAVPTASRIETGELLPQRFQVELIARALQCGVSDLAGASI